MQKCHGDIKNCALIKRSMPRHKAAVGRLKATTTDSQEQTAQFFIDYLERITLPTCLILDNQNLSLASIQALAIVLRIDTNLSHLYFNKSQLSSSIEVLAQTLEINANLRFLSLCETNLNEANVKALARMLRVNTHLHALDLSYNYLNDASIADLSEALQLNKSLRFLELEKCELSDAGISTLAQALAADTGRLRSLNLSFNHFNEARVIALAVALVANRSLRSLRFLHDDSQLSYSTKLSKACIIEVATMLKVNTTLRSLTLETYVDCEESKMILTEALAINTGLHQVYFGDLSTIDAAIIPDKVLEKNTSLHSLRNRPGLLKPNTTKALLRNRQHCHDISSAAVIFFAYKAPVLETPFGRLPWDLFCLIYAHTLSTFNRVHAVEIAKIVRTMVDKRHNAKQQPIAKLITFSIDSADKPGSKFSSVEQESKNDNSESHNRLWVPN
jgi:hypothetical protein